MLPSQPPRRHNYLLFDSLGSSCNIGLFTTTGDSALEGDVGRLCPLVPHAIRGGSASNDQLQLSSQARLDTAMALVNRHDVTIDDVMDMTRHPHLLLAAEPSASGLLRRRHHASGHQQCGPAGASERNEYQRLSFRTK
ncbi:MAG: hypothetical protein R2706_11955 [Acidimicrobiales bacterium]